MTRVPKGQVRQNSPTTATVGGASVHTVGSIKPACFGCKSTTRKLNPVPGTKTMVGCAECIRKRKKEKSTQGRARRQMTTFGITLEEEALIVEFQGGACICAKWTGYNGRSRSLSTDHDHKTGEIRGKLCKHCNDLLGRIKDDPDYFRRMIAYLEDPPAKRLLGSRVVPGHGD